MILDASTVQVEPEYALIDVVRYMAQNTHQMMLYLMFCGGVMDTTINLDEELLAHAQD